MANSSLLRLSALLSFIGVGVYVVLNILHPGGPGSDQAVFTLYSSSSSWVAIHLGQFVGEAVLTAGLLVLYFALNIVKGTSSWLGFFAAIAAAVAIALDGVVYAVDGVALKQAVDA